MNLIEWLYPVRTGITFFDYWFLAHLGFWFFVASTISATLDQGKGWIKYIFPFVSCLFMAALWEGFERGAEEWWPHMWQNPESDVNVASDIVTCLLGCPFMWWGYETWRKR
jgi:hypothetical protein